MNLPPSPPFLPSVLALALVALLPLPAGAATSSASLPSLDEGLASFGAAVAGDALYVYGGHVGRTHQHSKQNLSHRFQRLDLADPEAGWQDLGEVRGLQGLALVAHDGRVCRLGGLDARNEQGDEEDLYSIDEVACYDPQSDTWTDLPPLPAPRSSHDAAVLGDRVYVAGGWELRGRGNEPVWRDDLLVLDLAVEEPAWHSVPQPFERRALAVAVAGGVVHVLGGLTPEGTSLRVDRFDPASESWSEGPELPIAEGPMRGFGASAFGVGERVLLSGGDGSIYALDVASAEGSSEERDAWVEVGTLEHARFFHRLLPHDDRLLFVAGAHSGSHQGDIEIVELSSLRNVPLEEGGPLEEVASWPGFRGDGSAHTEDGALPVHWSDEEGVAWRVELPGYGQSAPIVRGDRVYVTSVEGEEKETLVLGAYDITHGKVHWQRRLKSLQRQPSSEMVSRSAPTPTVDAHGVYAFWETGDLVAFDPEGEVLWRRSLVEDYGEFTGNHGVASSPVLAGDLVIVQVTHEGPSYFVAFDRRDGEVRWKTDREPGVAWTTPVVAEGPDGPEVISSAAGRVEALDAATGELLWRIDGIEKNHVPSVTVDGDWIAVASSAASHNLALRRNGPGAEIAWRAEGVTSGFGSPVFHGGCVLFVNKAGVVTCVDRETGEERFKHRLPEAVWATPIVAGERVYFFSKNGEAVVLRHGPDGPEVEAENRVATDDTVYGVAAARGGFLLRTGRELIRVGE